MPNTDIGCFPEVYEVEVTSVVQQVISSTIPNLQSLQPMLLQDNYGLCSNPSTGDLAPLACCCFLYHVASLCM